MYRGDERTRLGFFLDSLPALVRGSKDGELHARRARTSRIFEFSFATSSVLAMGAGAIASSVIDDPDTGSMIFGATIAATIGFFVAAVWAGDAKHAELMRAINAYNYDLVRGALSR
jgi:hypothetical protein